MLAMRRRRITIIVGIKGLVLDFFSKGNISKKHIRKGTTNNINNLFTEINLFNESSLKIEFKKRYRKIEPTIA